MKKGKCDVCQKEFPLETLTHGSQVYQGVFDEIAQRNSEFSGDSLICLTDLNRYRSFYVKKMIEKDIGEVEELEAEVIKSLEEHELLSEDINKAFYGQLSFGDRLSDKLAEFGGSWTFISLFALILLGWIVINSLVLAQKPFDPYPYILLNLILSCLAAIQAPIIMMSQNRQEAKDRLRADMDYKINLKAELEIRHLKLKLDQLASHQWRRLLEIQNLQTDLIEEVGEKIEKSLQGRAHNKQ
ncbi:MAG: DUF1003 domain-containing protein [Bdellovibrionales bacterium]|nr:DUF1003 domain-containing protein [Bdellovibrionales bacterium]